MPPPYLSTVYRLPSLCRLSTRVYIEANRGPRPDLLGQRALAVPLHRLVRTVQGLRLLYERGRTQVSSKTHA